MKIAICLSGHLRCYKELIKNFNEFKNHISNFGDVDIFISTWDKYNVQECYSNSLGVSSENSINKKINIDEVKNLYETDNISVLNQDFFNSKYSPFVIDKLTNIRYDGDIRFISSNRILYLLNFLFLINDANKQKNIQEFKNNIKYDTCFRVRPDFLYSKNIYNINENNINNSMINVAIHPLSSQQGFKILKDDFIFGKSELMDIYSNLIYNISDCFNIGIFDFPEKVITILLNKFNIPINEIINVGYPTNENSSDIINLSNVGLLEDDIIQNTMKIRIR